MAKVATDSRVKDTLVKIIDLMGRASTLEVKEALRNQYPNDIWNQADVSTAVSEIHDEMDNLTYRDNGTFRIYSYVSPLIQQGILKAQTKAVAKATNKKPKAQVVKKRCSRTSAVEHIRNTKGKFFTVTFIKQNGDERTINGNVRGGKEFSNNLGYIRVKENYQQGTTARHRLINPQTIKKLKVGNVVYTVTAPRKKN